MKSLLTGLAVCAVLGGAHTAAAQDQEPAASKFGIGVASSFFVTGLEGQLRIDEKIGIEALFGFSVLSPDVDGADSITVIQIGARGLYKLFDLGERADASAFGGIGIRSDSAADNTLIGLEGGLKLAYMMVPYASIHVDFGLAIGINEVGDDGMGGSINATALDLGRGDLFGGAGWTFWW
jgi:hypothetical protein